MDNTTELERLLELERMCGQLLAASQRGDFNVEENTSETLNNSSSNTGSYLFNTHNVLHTMNNNPQ